MSETLLATITRSSSSRTRACVVSCNLLAAGHHTVEELTESRRPSNGQPYKIPRLMAAKEGERTQLMRILLSRGIGGIGDRTRGLTQRWFDMVDWRSAHVGNTRLGVSRSIEGYTETLKGEVHQQHPARTWVERQEQKSGGHEPERIPTTRECEHHRWWSQRAEEATGEAGWKAADPSRYPQQMCRGLARDTCA